MTSTNLRKAEDAAAGVSTIISVFVALEIIIIGTVLLASDAPPGFSVGGIIFLGIISIFGLLLFYYSWQSIYEVLMHIGSPLEEEPVTRDSSRPSDNSPTATASAPATEGGKRCSYSTPKGIRCQNWFDGEGPYCDVHSLGSSTEPNGT